MSLFRDVYYSQIIVSQ